jgi:hypothetical protein
VVLAGFGVVWSVITVMGRGHFLLFLLGLAIHSIIE